MANSKIFCPIPWFELNINQDGSFDLCGCQNDKIWGTPLGQVYNIKNLTIEEYWNSERLKQSRMIKLGDTIDTMCNMCQQKDQVGYESNRVKELSKSVIFFDNFERSYQQSPNRHHFDYSRDTQGLAKSLPRSLHIYLGDTCNFSCRMCSPYNSTRLQTEFQQLHWISKDTQFNNWADDPTAWKNFTDYLEKYIDHVRVLHIIGGEVAFIPKFHWLVDYFVKQGRADQVNLSFTINGSRTYEEYFSAFEQYKRIEIGVSIESVNSIGDYIRQGGNIDQILKNIEYIKNNRPSNTELVIRTAPSLLSLPDYHDLVSWAYDIGIPIDNSLLVRPLWQRGVLLPDNIKELVVNRMTSVLNRLPAITGNEFKNQKDPNKIAVSMRNECEGIIELAKTPAPADADVHLKTCAEKLSQWDQLKSINIKDYSLELYGLLKQYGYVGA